MKTMEWIDVNKKQPEEGARVLTLIEGNNIFITEYIDGEFRQGKSKETRKMIYKYVTHWLIPKPPIE